jgi:hypothetical protein
MISQRLKKQIRSADDAGFIVHRQLPSVAGYVMPQNVAATFIATELEVSMVRRQPGVEHLNDFNGPAIERKAPRRLFAAIAGVTLHPSFKNRFRPRSVSPGRSSRFAPLRCDPSASLAASFQLMMPQPLRTLIIQAMIGCRYSIIAPSARRIWQNHPGRSPSRLVRGHVRERAIGENDRRRK